MQQQGVNKRTTFRREIRSAKELSEDFWNETDIISSANLFAIPRMVALHLLIHTTKPNYAPVWKYFNADVIFIYSCDVI